MPALSRRLWLGHATLWAISPLLPSVPHASTPVATAAGTATHPAANTATPRMAAAWATGAAQWVGVLQLPHPTQTAAAPHIVQAEPVPTRAHGMAALRDGSIVFASRRPGDWLLRLPHGPSADHAQWQWIEDDRAFNGHVIESADGQHLYTTETDLATGQGLVGVRDVHTLEKIAEWPTGGMDPHQLLLDADGSLIVANGGIPTQPETGRRKLRLDHMDSSIARLLPAKQGRIAGQWRLPDTRLSLRHLAWGPRVAWRPQQRWLGIALQAEHTDDADRAQAPVLALWDGEQLHAAPLPAGAELAGYGGDIGSDGQHFAVSCPRADQLTWWQPPATPQAPGQWLHAHSLQGVYCVANHSPSHAIAAEHAQLWVGGQLQAQLRTSGQPQPLQTAPLNAPPLQLDNHWIPLPKAVTS